MNKEEYLIKAKKHIWAMSRQSLIEQYWSSYNEIDVHDIKNWGIVSKKVIALISVDTEELREICWNLTQGSVLTADNDTIFEDEFTFESINFVDEDIIPSDVTVSIETRSDNIYVYIHNKKEFTHSDFYDANVRYKITCDTFLDEFSNSIDVDNEWSLNEFVPKNFTKQGQIIEYFASIGVIDILW